MNCNDSNPCTNDSCNQLSGCAHADNTNPCSDGNACTTDDICMSGECKPGPNKSCADDKWCSTWEICDTKVACHTIYFIPTDFWGDAHHICDTDKDGYQDDDPDMDADNDGICDQGETTKPGQPCSGQDNCWLVANTDQKDTDNDGFGDACDPDKNGDGIKD